MAEVEFGGVKFKGGKMVAVILSLSTLIGGLYGAFEVYKDYTSMKKKIASYKAPDLTGFDKRLDLIRKDTEAAMVRVAEIQDIARDIRQDTRADAASLESAISSVDKRSRTLDVETRAAMRQAESTLREIASSASKRFDVKINSVDEKLETLEDRLNKTLQRALDNPLLKSK
tara:strand:+ start:490 stop:1005 length:516 start_codon:yes stop_codon:yes gene_type:complete